MSSSQSSTSYFLRMVPLENTSRSHYMRNNDERIAQLQFPVGWALFSRENVNRLISSLGKHVKGIDLDYLCPVLQWAYDTRGRIMEETCGDGQKQIVAECVKDLNKLIEHRVTTVLAGTTKSHVHAVNVFHGRDMRPYWTPIHQPSKRVEDRKSFYASQTDPAADPSGMFGA
jgi:hypothetical protein